MFLGRWNIQMVLSPPCVVDISFENSIFLLWSPWIRWMNEISYSRYVLHAVYIHNMEEMTRTEFKTHFRLLSKKNCISERWQIYIGSSFHCCMNRMYIFPNLFFFFFSSYAFSFPFSRPNVYVSICGQYFVCHLDIQMHFRPIHFHERERERCCSNICYPLRIWLDHPTWYPIESEIHIRFGKKWIKQCARYIFALLTCSLSNPPASSFRILDVENPTTDYSLHLQLTK